MAYAKFYDPWHDLPDRSTPINAAALNHIEQGIADAGRRAAAVVVGFSDCDVNVSDYSTADVALQVASDALAGTGGLILVREGVYTQSAEVTYPTCVSILGAGLSDNTGSAAAKGTIFKWADSLGSSITGKFLLKFTGGHNSWSNFGIDGNRPTNTGGGGIGVKANRQWGSNVTIVNCRSVSLDQDGGGTSGAIANIYTNMQIKGGGSYGFNSHGGNDSDTEMVNVIIGACDKNMFTGGGGQHFTNCHFWGSTSVTAPSITANSAAGYSTYTNCDIESNATEMLIVSPTLMSGCRFWKNGSTSGKACRVVNADHFKLVNSYVVDNIGIGLSFEGTSSRWSIEATDFYDDANGSNPGFKTQTYGIHTQDTAGDGEIGSGVNCRDSDHLTAGFNFTATNQLPVFGTSNAVTTNAQTGTAYTLVAGDGNRTIEIANAAAITLTVPTNASVPFAIGTQIPIVQTGAGQITVAGAGGVTVNATPGLKVAAQWAKATLTKRATDTWVLTGNLSA